MVALASGVHAGAALTAAIHDYMTRRINAGALEGPLQRVHCHAAGALKGPRRAFSCDVRAGSVGYPFLGVVDVRARRVTYCKRDPPPAPSDNVPVSPRCQA